MTDDFSFNVKQFIDQNIESLAQLEALLLMRQDLHKSWDAEEIAKALYTSSELAAALLTDFGRRGFLKSLTDGRYTFNAEDSQFSQLMDEIAAAYQERRVAVISLIYSKPLNKVQTLADAFRLRKEGPQ